MFMQPNAYSRDDMFFDQVAAWSPQLGYFHIFSRSFSSNSSQLYSAGFLERDMALKNPFKDFGQSTMVVAMSYGPTFSYKYRYPGNLTVRTGADFWAARYLSQALNFKLQ